MLHRRVELAGESRLPKTEGGPKRDSSLPSQLAESAGKNSRFRVVRRLQVFEQRVFSSKLQRVDSWRLASSISLAKYPSRVSFKWSWWRSSLPRTEREPLKYPHLGTETLTLHVMGYFSEKRMSRNPLSFPLNSASSNGLSVFASLLSWTIWFQSFRLVKKTVHAMLPRRPMRCLPADWNMARRVTEYGA